jgi:hypothetical protein
MLPVVKVAPIRSSSSSSDASSTGGESTCEITPCIISTNNTDDECQ